MKDVIIGFEHDGVKYGAYFVFSEKDGIVVAACASLKDAATGLEIGEVEGNAVLDAEVEVVSTMLQAHIMKEKGYD